MKAAILLQTGFLCDAGPSTGLYALMNKLGALYPNRNEVWIGIRVHDARLDPDVNQIIGAGVDRIIHIGHSFGCGHGLLNFARLLKFRREDIDLACLIDPVPDEFGWRLRRTEKPFPVPETVRSCFAARTLNKPGWLDPWGRPVEHALLVREVVYTPEGMGVDDGQRRVIPDPSVQHCNIDGDYRLHDEIVRAVETVMAF